MSGLERKLPYVAITVIVTVLLLFAVRVPLSRMDVPYKYSGDTIDKVAQIRNVAETGWLFHNDRLGYPFGYDRLDFPRFDSVNYAVMGPIAAATRQAGLAINLYFIAGFFLIGFAAFHCLRRIGANVGVAVVCALVYTFLPYHLSNGVEHLTNGTYFLVPFGMLALIWLAQGRLAGADARKYWPLALATAVLLPLQTPYNGFFFALLCPVAGAIALARRASWRAAIGCLALLLAVGVTFAAELTPMFLHSLANGTAASTGERVPYAADVFSLRLHQVLLPTVWDHLKWVAHAKRGFDQAMHMDQPYTEVSNQYIGALGVLGFVALFWVLARATRQGARAADTDLERATQVVAILAICVLLIAMSSGVGAIIAYWVTSKVRAYSRILPFLAFACTIGAAWILQTALQRVRNAALRQVFVSVVGILALFDVTVAPMFGNRGADVAAYDRDRAYFSSMEARLGDGATVFQLPVVWYPEHPPVGAMGDYEEFKPFLLTRTLRFSYGSSRTRTGYRWGKFVEQSSPAEMVARTHAMGFRALLVDTSAYADAATRDSTTAALTHASGQPPMVSSDGRWWTFPLEGCCGAEVPPIAPGEAPDLFDYAVASKPLRFGTDGYGALYATGSWAAPEDWGMWQLGTEAGLRMRLQPPTQDALVVTLDTRMLVGSKLPERRLRVECNGAIVADVTYSQAAPARQLRLDIPRGLIGEDGVLALRFEVTPPATPLSAGVSADARPLALGLSQLEIVRAPAGTADAR